MRRLARGGFVAVVSLLRVRGGGFLAAVSLRQFCCGSFVAAAIIVRYQVDMDRQRPA